MPKERPILFGGEMVRAIRSGRKTQTRRIVKLDAKSVLSKQQIAAGWTFSVDHARVDYPIVNMPRLCVPWKHPEDSSMDWSECACQIIHTPFEVGTPLWVKETHLPKSSGTIYRADFDPVEAAGLGGMYGGWKPSIFCKRKDSRITLEIVSVCAERLQSISGADAQAEGWPREQELYPTVNTNSKAQDWYRRVWHEINGVKSWNSNPWVWVVTFKENCQ